MTFDTADFVAGTHGHNTIPKPPEEGLQQKPTNQTQVHTIMSFSNLRNETPISSSPGNPGPEIPSGSFTELPSLNQAKEAMEVTNDKSNELPNTTDPETSPVILLDFHETPQALEDLNDGFEGDDELDVVEAQRKKKTMFNSKSELKKKAAGKFSTNQLFNTAMFRSAKSSTPPHSSDSEGIEEFPEAYNAEAEDTSAHSKPAKLFLRKMRSSSDAGLPRMEENPEKEREFFPSLTRRRFRKSRTKSDVTMSDTNGNNGDSTNPEDFEVLQCTHSDTELGNIAQNGDHSKKKSMRRNFPLIPTEAQPGHARRHTIFTLDHSPTIDWKDLRNSLKFNLLGANKKKKEGPTDHSYLKSAELISELSAGAPAVIILASMFQRDDRNTQKIPILLEQLKLKVSDTSLSLKDKNRHYLIELEYGSGPARLRWSVRKEFKDFWSFHSKFKVANFQGNIVGTKLVLPKFPARHSIFNKVEQNHKEQAKKGTAGAGTGEGVPLSPRNSIFGHRANSFASGPSQNGEGITRHYSAISEEGSRNTSIFSDSSQSFSGLSSRTSNYFKKNRARFTRSVGTFWDISNVNEVVQKDYIEVLRCAVEKYVLELFKVLRFRADANRLFQFLEVSNMTIRLAPESPFHGKEGYLILRSSAMVQGWRVSHWKPNDISQMVVRHTSKWYMVRESYILCVKDISASNILEVFLVDPGFRVTHSDSGKDEEDPYSSQVHITFQLENLERKMKLVTNSRRQLGLWMSSITQMKDNTVWSKPHRFNSFAPVRTNVQAQWFVDAVSITLCSFTEITNT